jgi:hypothetical protein
LKNVFNNAQVKEDSYLYSYALDSMEKPFIFSTKDLKLECRFILNPYFDTDLLLATKKYIMKLIKIHKANVMIEQEKSHQERNKILTYFVINTFCFSQTFYYLNKKQLRILLAKLCHKYIIPTNQIYDLYKQYIKKRRADISLDSLNLSAIIHYQDISTIANQIIPQFDKTVNEILKDTNS